MGQIEKRNQDEPAALKNEEKMIDDTLRIRQLNVEGLSKDKCNYLQNIDVLALQETHIPS